MNRAWSREPPPIRLYGSLTSMLTTPILGLLCWLRILNRLIIEAPNILGSIADRCFHDFVSDLLIFIDSGDVAGVICDDAGFAGEAIGIVVNL